MRDSESTNRRAIRIGIVAVAGILVVGKAMPWIVHSVSQASVEAELRAATLARSRSLIAGYARDSGRARAAAQRLDSLRAHIIQAGTPAAAASALMDLVTDAAADAGVATGAWQLARDTTSHPGPAVLTISGTISSGIRGLTRFLAMLHEHRMLMRVRQLSIAAPDPGGVTGAPERLDVALVIDALVELVPEGAR